MTTRRADGVSLVQGQEKTDVAAQHSGRESQFSLPPPFCSLQILNGLDDAHPP